MNQFKSFTISQSSNYKRETEGAVPKLWVQTSEGRALFKDACQNQYYPEVRSDWPEKITNELANSLSLPTARYEFAQLESPEGLIPGSISFELSDYGGLREPLEVTLEETIDNYNYGSDYNVSNVLNVLEKQDVQLPPGYSLPEGINTGSDMFVGALMLDACICNIDRHSRNFDVVTDLNEGVKYFSPIFDNGRSLGSFLQDDLKVDRSISDYSQSAQSSISVDGYRKSGLAVFQEAAKLKPEAAKIWQNELSKIDRQQIQALFDRIPKEIITPTSREFAVDLLEHNQSRLLSLSIDREITNVDISQVSFDRLKGMDNVLFDLASSAKYVALNEGKELTESNKRVYDFPHGVSIEKTFEGLSISYDDKSIEFDRDFNVVKNELNEVKIRQIDKLTQETKQQSLEQSRSQQIKQDIDIER